MNISEEQFRNLISFVAKTTDDEISCQTCEDRIAQFAEVQLSGKEVPEALRAIEEHLEICPECTEELEYIRQALEGDLDRG